MEKGLDFGLSLHMYNTTKVLGIYIYSSLNSASDTFSVRTSEALIVLLVEAGNMPMEQEDWKNGKMKTKILPEVFLGSKKLHCPLQPP